MTFHSRYQLIILLVTLASHHNHILAFSPTSTGPTTSHYRYLQKFQYRNNGVDSPKNKVSSISTTTQLRNLPLEDALEVELWEMEVDLDLKHEVVDEEESTKQMKATDAASIIAGTAVGGGFLALPAVTAPIGYFPAVLGLLAAWSFLMLSATAFIESAGLVADIKRMEAAQASEGNTTATGAAVEDGAISVATVIRYAFGKKFALLGGTLFITQMLAVVTAQVVKGAELFSDSISFIPYIAGCLVPTTLAGLFAFRSRPEVVEAANTALTFMMVGGFVALIIGTITTGNIGKAAGAIFARADYSKLLPRGKGWALPVFINMICFGQAMPLVVERMVQGSSSESTSATKDNANGDANVDVVNGSSTYTRAMPLFRARTALFLGGGVPIILSLTWAAISTALVAPTTNNPLQYLLSRGPAISIPVGLLSIGAIGTTLLGSFLAMGHFAADVVCMKLGYCSFSWMNICNAVTVAVPAILACIGPSMYLPLLAFAGAYPTTILHALSPALAALVLRRRIRKNGIGEKAIVSTPRLVPGGDSTLVGVSATAVGLICASTYLALRQFIR